ncbi:MAG TPA: formate dehydrogenase accessory sulfurtransferase FdhD [Oscillatoriaceae cyanobacterium]
MQEQAARWRTVSIGRYEGEVARACDDAIAIEEPLEIRLSWPGGDRSVSITMRTPGHDLELAAGFLFTEGLIASQAAIDAIKPCGPPSPEGFRNTIRVMLRDGAGLDLERLTRHFYTTSSCGVCGKSSLEALRVAGLAPLPREGFAIAPAVVEALPERARAAQAVFDRTGGLHAAALMDAEGQVLDLYEDVGRHNAVDKLIGAQMLAGRTPLRDAVLFVSGRASFELVQKALVAGIPMLAAVGAPSSLAVALAAEFGLTLAGFVRDGRFNVYSGAWRVGRPA